MALAVALAGSLISLLTSGELARQSRELEGLPRYSLRDSIGDSKIKRGLPGFVNGSRTSGLADTGASQNIVSAASVRRKRQSRELEGLPRYSLRDSIGDTKIKRGLPGFINGSRTSGLADTGASQNIVSAASVRRKRRSVKKNQNPLRRDSIDAESELQLIWDLVRDTDTGASQNIVSAAFVQEKRLSIIKNRSYFRLGNSKIAESIGTVSLRWAFSEKPEEIIDIICHVLPQCAYHLILGSKFLTATETFSKHRRRLVDCVFSNSNVFQLNFLDGGRQTLDGKVGGYQVLAIPDTGAERNVMDLDYAEDLGFKINPRSEDHGFLQFADGTIQETVGQVNTTWTFASGLKIPVTFEVLENCSADVILGEEILWEYDVFETYAASIHEMPSENGKDELLDIAPFSYMKKWQQNASDFKHKISSKFNKRPHGKNPLEDETVKQYEDEERERRDHWHHQYGFGGENASPAEKEAEAQRKRRYNARIEDFRRRPPCPGTTVPLISSVPTAPNDASTNPTATGTGPRRAPPLIPSIPTAPNDAPVALATTDARRTKNGVSRSTAIVPPDDAPGDPAVIDQRRRGLRF